MGKREEMRRFVEGEPAPDSAPEPATVKKAAKSGAARAKEAVQSAADAVRAWADGEDPEEAAERVRSLVGRLHSELTDPARSEDQLVMAAAQDLARLVAVLDPPTAPTAGSSAVTRG